MVPSLSFLKTKNLKPLDSRMDFLPSIRPDNSNHPWGSLEVFTPHDNVPEKSQDE